MGGAVLAGAGFVLWQVLGSEPSPGVGPEEVQVPVGPASPRALPEPRLPRPLSEKPPPAKEGLYVAGEEFPPFGEGFAQTRRIYLPEHTERTARGGELRDALLALPDVYLRWQSEDVKRAFLRAELRLSPDTTMGEQEGRPAGAPIPSAFMHLPEAGFRAWVRPPVVWIFELGTPNPDAMAR